MDGSWMAQKKEGLPKTKSRRQDNNPIQSIGIDATLGRLEQIMVDPPPRSRTTDTPLLPRFGLWLVMESSLTIQRDELAFCWLS